MRKDNIHGVKHRTLLEKMYISTYVDVNSQLIQSTARPFFDLNIVVLCIPYPKPELLKVIYRGQSDNIMVTSSKYNAEVKRFN